MKKKVKGKPAAKPAKKVVSKKPASRQAAKPASKDSVSTSRPMSSIGVQPLGDRVLVRPIGQDEVESVTSFGIIIPDSAKEKPEQGTVVAVGPGKVGDDNEFAPMQVAVGDKVMFSKYGYDTLKVEGVEHYILSEANILAILN